MTMTNNPTIDGVSLLPCAFCGDPGRADNGFGLCESIYYAWCTNQECFMSDGVDMGVTPEAWNKRAAPVVERQPVAEVIATGGPHDREDRVLCELQAELPPVGTKLYAVTPKVSALQSTIAQQVKYREALENIRKQMLGGKKLHPSSVYAIVCEALGELNE